ncbi:WHG domain-containing protein [Lentzea xinjiangensis]|uniref:WHG domain-containing protein n=1 Tax=Lentzea xinjiangensis TaxID=402600 RepID=A0A1H9BTZ4_9PSEU|nr:TetR-like C-terminal domain-containing protein [Lentzea xinjiangensis]SEP92043.1 WHG domain-containing protein [Lentzea xinjiangensis]
MSRPGCREAVVAAATALVDADRAVTLRAVARAARLPTSAVYQHFSAPPAILAAVCQQAFEDLEATVLAATGAHAAGLAYLDFAVAHPRRYRVMFGAADLAAPALRLFTRVLAGSGRTDPAADALTLWLGLHGLADQRASTRRSPRFAALAPRLIASLI